MTTPSDRETRRAVLRERIVTGTLQFQRNRIRLAAIPNPEDEAIDTRASISVPRFAILTPS